MKVDFIQGINNNWNATLDLKCFNDNCSGSLVFDHKRITENDCLNIYSFVIPIACSVCGSPTSISLSFKKQNTCISSSIRKRVEI
jgi:hypothetical protein